MQMIRIGTRASALAMRQAALAAETVRQAFPDAQIEFVKLTTKGDRISDAPLVSFGGKGAFVSEFEEALLDGRIDLAVHSAKDMPMALSEGLAIAAVLPRADARDVLVARAVGMESKYAAVTHTTGTESKNTSATHAAGTENKDAPVMYAAGADTKNRLCIGTSSPRRAAQIRTLMDAECRTLRGNVPTRIEKLKNGAYDGILLAAAGLSRLGLDRDPELSYRYLSFEEMVPAGGQGIIALEAKTGTQLYEKLAAVSDTATMLALETERYVLRCLQAGCHEAVGVYADVQGGQMTLFVMAKKAGKVVRLRRTGACEARFLLADAILMSLKDLKSRAEDQMPVE